MLLISIALAIAVAVYLTNKIDALQNELNELIAEERNARYEHDQTTDQILWTHITNRDIHNKE